MGVRWVAAALGGALAVAGCGRGDGGPPWVVAIAPEPQAAGSAAAAPSAEAGSGAGAPSAAAPAAPPSKGPGPFDARLLEAAREHGKWPKVVSVLGWASTDCMPPRTDDVLHVSSSEDADTHGQKLYYLFARDRDAYFPRRAGAAPVGQVLVKESWAPKPLLPGEPRGKGDVAELGGKSYRAGEKRALFLMMKLEPSTPGTDQGWVYGVVSPGGDQVLAAGALHACARCHAHAPGDRLFGPP